MNVTNPLSSSGGPPSAGTGTGTSTGAGANVRTTQSLSRNVQAIFEGMSETTYLSYMYVCGRLYLDLLCRITWSSAISNRCMWMTDSIFISIIICRVVAFASFSILRPHLTLASLSFLGH